MTPLKQVNMRLSKILITLATLMLVSGLSIAEEEKSGSGVLSVGKDLTYVRGTARAKEEWLEFPYRHRASGDRAYWASVVHNGKGLRLIVKADECQGKKDKSGQIVNQDFEPDHPFMKVLDQIKSDAFFNLHEELLKKKPTDKEGWKILGGGTAVYQTFYKDSEGRIFCFLGVQDESLKTIQGPVVAYFQRSRRGPLMSALQADGKTWSPPQPIDPRTNSASHRAFSYVESRPGF